MNHMPDLPVGDQVLEQRSMADFFTLIIMVTAVFVCGVFTGQMFKDE